MRKSIGPVASYQDVYVAACGRDFPDHKSGRLHEEECGECSGYWFGDDGDSNQSGRDG